MTTNIELTNSEFVAGFPRLAPSTYLCGSFFTVCRRGRSHGRQRICLRVAVVGDGVSQLVLPWVFPRHKRGPVKTNSPPARRFWVSKALAPFQGTAMMDQAIIFKVRINIKYLFLADSVCFLLSQHFNRKIDQNLTFILAEQTFPKVVLPLLDSTKMKIWMVKQVLNFWTMELSCF